MTENDRAGLTAVDGESGVGRGVSHVEREDWEATDGRKFGLVVGGAFLALAGLIWWQGHYLPAWVGLAVGSALAVAGLLIPSRIHPVYRGWMALARGISRVTTPVVLALVYFLVLTPTGFLRRRLGTDPLRKDGAKGTYWRIRDDGRSDLERQF